MIFNELTVYTNSVGYELVSGVLFGLGVSSFAVEDRADLDEILANKSIPIDYVEDKLLAENKGEVRIKIYLADNEQGGNLINEIEAGIDRLRDEYKGELGSLEIKKGRADDNDWADNWREFFHPLPIGDTFLIKPSWEQVTAGDRLVIEIDPESSFGTGQHETTALCLELLETLDVKHKNVLDMGCGSGILGIAAALMGAHSVLCVDIDKNATDIAARNAVVNKLKPGNLSVLCGNVLEDKVVYDRVCESKYHVILANIAADIIIEMAPVFTRIIEKSGVIVCSGIIEQKKDVVLSSLNKNGFFVSEEAEKNDWVALKCIPKKDQK
jgi:ribosomal protein L11 methyltransferase